MVGSREYGTVHAQEVDPSVPHAPHPPSFAPPPDPRPVRPIQKERPFALGLLLTIVTLGIYPLFWHYLTHDELSRQMGVENRAKGLWIAYIALYVGSFFVSLLSPADPGAGDPETPAEVLEALTGSGGWAALALVITLAMTVLYVLYVLRQWEQLRDAKARMGLAVRGSAAQFFLLTFGSFGIMLLFFWLILPLLAPFIMIPIAYYYLNENYNDVAAAMRTGQVDAYAYRPGGEGWQGAADRPPTEGPAPLAPGAVPTPPSQWIRTTAPSPSHPGHPPPPPHYGTPTSSWDTPRTPDEGGHGRTAAQGGALHGTDAAHHEGGREGSGFSIHGRGAPETGRETYEQVPPRRPRVEQAFQCPRCHTQVVARGTSGEPVTVHCGRCGESGAVTLPEV